MSDFSSLVMYIVFFTLACLLMYVSQLYKKTKQGPYIFFLIVSFLIPLTISGVRYGVGTDYFNYIRGYDLSVNVSFVDFFESKNMELGFFTIRKIASFFHDYRLMFWISTFITLLFFYLTIIEHENKVPAVLSLMIYLFVFFPSSFNIVRQHIALAIILYSYKYIFEKKFIKYLMFCILASCFHMTALIMLPFYFVFSADELTSDFSCKKKTLLRLIIIFIFIIFVMNFETFFQSISKVEIFDKFERYSMENNTGANREIFLKGLILIIVSLFKKRLIRHDRRNHIYIYFLIIDIVITFVGFYNPFVKRVGLYFGITQVMLLPSLVTVMSNKVEKYIVKVGICIYSISFFILAFYILRQSHIIPYNFYL